MGVQFEKDHYNERARREGYRARSVYKLQEIQDRFKILRKGSVVVDLGAAPGSWSQYLAEIVGPKGRVVAVDRTEMDPNLPAQVLAVHADVFTVSPEALREAAGDAINVVVSDMAPRTSGTRHVDHLRNIALCEQAMLLADGVLPAASVSICWRNGKGSRKTGNSVSRRRRT